MHTVTQPIRIVSLLLCGLLCSNVWGGQDTLLFDCNDTGDAAIKGTAVAPWKTIATDEAYGGQWMVAGDIDGDGQVEIVTAENRNEGDVHYTSAVAAQELDGQTIWHWGRADEGRKKWHHDVACQIHDWDHDGKPEVVLCDQGSIVELDAQTGREKRRIEIPKDATDCVTFCDLSGKGWPSDVLVKNRYHQIWAYNYAGKLVWTVKDPGRYRTAHQCRPIDIDGDGRDEIMAGYAMLNHDGSVRWVYANAANRRNGHLDCVRVFKRAKTPEDFRLVLTCCGASNIAMIDGLGRVVWEQSGRHFESIDVGRFVPGQAQPQVIVDIDHQPFGKSPIWVLDAQGKQVGQIVTNYSRHHALLDWDGDGYDEIVVGHNRGIYNYQGRRIATLLKRSSEKSTAEESVLVGDMNGDRIPDVTIASTEKVTIYLNENGKPKDIPLGTEFNFTLY